VTRLLARHRPAAAAVEDVFVKSDPRAALSIGHGRGAVLAVLGGHGIPVHDYPPASVKRSVAGNGRAGKEQVARMVGILLGADVGAIPRDATDALAVAIAHALAARTQAIVGEEVKRPQAR
jgi:crossover junction endodeoxyribonuclease RuvC